MSNVSVVANCSDWCRKMGCQYDSALSMVNDARRIQNQAATAIKESRVGFALWCDDGGHPFSEKEDNMSGQRTVTRNGKREVEDYLICATCMEKKRNPPIAAIQNTETQDKVPTEVDW